MDAFPLRLGHATGNPRLLLGGVAIAVLAILSIWLLVVAGLESRGTHDGIVPGPMPEGPSVVQTDRVASGVEVGPLPGVEIAPIGGDVSPR